MNDLKKKIKEKNLSKNYVGKRVYRHRGLSFRSLVVKPLPFSDRLRLRRFPVRRS